jgi:hypothetical protein
MLWGELAYNEQDDKLYYGKGDAGSGNASAAIAITGAGVYQPVDATLTALAGANWAANALPIGSGADTVAQVTFGVNTFPARASTGNLVAKAITDEALSLLSVMGTGALTNLDSAGTLTSNDLYVGVSIVGAARVNFAANTFPARASTGSLSAKPITDFGLSLVDDADDAAARATLGLTIGTHVQAWDAHLDSLAGLTTPANTMVVGAGAGAYDMLTIAAGTFPARASTGGLVAKSISDDALSFVAAADYAAMRTALGVAIGTNVQAYDAGLASLAGLTVTANTVVIGGAGDSFGALTLGLNEFPARASTGGLLNKAISDDALAFVASANYAAMRTALGVPTTKGTYNGTLTGFTTSPVTTIDYVVVGDLCTLNIAGQSGTSNATTFTITGMPAAARPVSQRRCVVTIQNNGTHAFGLALIASGGTITLSRDASGANWTASGVKGINFTTITYSLIDP